MTYAIDSLLDFESLAQKNLGQLKRNLSTPALYEEAVKNREGLLSHLGPLVVRTGMHTERSADDRYVVKADGATEQVWWSGRNKPMSEERFENLLMRMLAYLQNRDLYVQDCQAGRQADRQVAFRIATETAWHSLFARNLFVQIQDQDQLHDFAADVTLLHVPGFQALPELDGTHSSAFVVIHLEKKIVLIGGTSYAFEIKDAVFALTQALIPQEEALSLRCAVNVGEAGDSALFLGRAGSGKTTLATDPKRRLIGDDHHGWDDNGLFNYEWGCYAKVANVSPQDEPQVYDCTRMFGTILENVTLDQSKRRVDFSDLALTENTRAAYPVSHIPGAIRSGTCGQPKNLFLLTRDPYGVLPPIARLTPEQALFTFLSSYRPRAEDDEIGDDPARVLFESCFGAAPLSIEPHRYAGLFLARLKKHGTQCWLMNTGYSGEPEGRAERVAIADSRAMVHAVLAGQLEQVEYETDPVFQFETPTTCPGVDDKILNPRLQALDDGEYEVRANRLASDFMRDFQPFIEHVPPGIREMLSQITLLEDSLDIMEVFRLSI